MIQHTKPFFSIVGVIKHEERVPTKFIKLLEYYDYKVCNKCAALFSSVNINKNTFINFETILGENYKVENIRIDICDKANSTVSHFMFSDLASSYRFITENLKLNIEELYGDKLRKEKQRIRLKFNRKEEK